MHDDDFNTPLAMVDKYWNNLLNDQVIQSVWDYVNECTSFKYWCDVHYQCSEHLFVLTTIIINRKLQGKSTFTAFLDAEKPLIE